MPDGQPAAGAPVHMPRVPAVLCAALVGTLEGHTVGLGGRRERKEAAFPWARSSFLPEKTRETLQKSLFQVRFAREHSHSS